MQVALMQLSYRVGLIHSNAQLITAAAQSAKAAGADFAAYSELSITGYPPMDLLKDRGFLYDCEQILLLIAKEVPLPVLVGSPFRDGRGLFNAYFMLYNNQVILVSRKSLLPNYDVFDESRYFLSSGQCSSFVLNSEEIGVAICEDLWFEDGQYPYPHDPLRHLMEQRRAAIRFVLNPAASPFSMQGQALRERVLKGASTRHKVPIAYVNQVGANGDMIFDGGTSVWLPHKGSLASCPVFTESFLLWDTQTDSAQAIDYYDHRDFKFSSSLHFLDKAFQVEGAEVLGQFFKAQEVTKALCLGIRDYLAMTGGKKVVIGLSGGVDSAVVLCLAVMALGSENVTALLMPSGYSSERSVEDSVALCRLHEVAYQILSIEDGFGAVMGTLQAQWETPPMGLTEENIQPRLRALFLMAYSNQYGAMWLNSSNKSEAAVGYSTLYGDMGGGLSVIGDLYKTQVYALANSWNSNWEWIPSSILEAAPSAELRPGQLDSDSLPPYPMLDAILMDRIEGGLDEEGLMLKGHDPDLVRRVMDMMRRSEFKRHQMPPVLRVSSRSFGRGWRRSLV
ncbi:MAG: NAD+ synthase [Bacteroidota bacterium]